MDTRFGRHVMQDLADLSGDKIPGLGLNRLASRYQKSIAERQSKERANDHELKLNIPHLHQVQQRLAEQLEEGAAKINGKLPVASVFDSLQLVKARKDLDKDAGLRALGGHLESIWKRNRTATITASSYLKLHDHYKRNFPKSAASEVIVEIGQRGYTTLPRKDLHHIASQIENQADYNRLIVKYGLSGPQPHQIKARNYILAVLDDDEGEEINPETGFTPSESGDVADWMVEREKHQQQGDDPGEFRKKNPPPKRRGPKGAQVDDDYESDEELWGDEPDEGDVVISDAGRLGGQTQVSFGGKNLGTFTEWYEMEDAIRGEGRRTNFWPNIWRLSDHGNYHLVKDFDWDAPVKEELEWDDPDYESGREGRRQAISDPSTLDDFTRGYLVAMLWAAPEDEEGKNLDEYGIIDIDDSDLSAAIADCEKFQAENAGDLEEYYRLRSEESVEGSVQENAGHDFALTRNGHGAGFWDRGVGEVGERLSEASRKFGDEFWYAQDGVVYKEGRRQAISDPSTLDDFTRGYLVAMLWAAPEDEEGKNLDEYGIIDIDDSDLSAAIADCEKFQAENAGDLEEYYRLRSEESVEGSVQENAGHDFALTRNGHGAGFWDRGVGEVGERLSEASRKFGDEFWYAQDGVVYKEGRRQAQSSSPYEDDLIEGLAHALWADAWLSGWEEAQEDGYVDDVPWPMGAQLEQYIPNTPEKALDEAKQVFSEIQAKNLDVDWAAFVPEGEDPGTFKAYDFGYYLGMEYMGHGVSWSDDHEDHGLAIPYGETPWDLQYEDKELEAILNQRNADFEAGEGRVDPTKEAFSTGERTT